MITILLSVNTLFANEELNLNEETNQLILCEKNYSTCTESCESIEDNEKYEACYAQCEQNREECEAKLDK
jgi:hypothetical protein